MSDPESDELSNKIDELDIEEKDEIEDGDDDFGDFDDFDEFEEAVPVEEEPQPPHPTPKLTTRLKETDFKSESLESTVLDILRLSITTGTVEPDHHGDSQPHITPKSYFSERSASLWNQLAVIAPEVHPLDWKRSSIRRLLLVSLGVPLDLDEILPKKHTKRLVLPNSTQNVSKQHDDNTTTNSKTEKEKQVVDELIKDTDANLTNWYQLAGVSKEALDGMDEQEMAKHVEELKKATEFAKDLCRRWSVQRDDAQKDKETFEGVIESLVEYAQKLRR